MSRYAFWDTNLLIYWMEDSPRWSSAVRELVAWQEANGLETITSSLSLGEILVHPLAKAEGRVAKKYAQLLTEIGCLTFGPDEAWRFGELRASHPSLRPPDAIQLACASVRGVEYFFTNDERLSRYQVEGIGKIQSLSGWGGDFP